MLRRALRTLTATSTGLAAGAMLFIRLVLLPFWQGLPPDEFRGWFVSHSDRIRRLMVPLGAAAAVSATTNAVAEAATSSGARASANVAAVSAVGVGVITYAVNEPANHLFVRQDLSDDDTVDLLHRWARWHDARVVLGLVGALAATRASISSRT